MSSSLHLLTAQAWRRALPVARVVLALLCLAPNPIFGSIYLAVAAALLFWRMPATPVYLLGTLVVDTVFLILAAFVAEIPELGVFGSIWFLFLMTTAVLLYDWREILVVTTCVLALAIVRKPIDFEQLVVSAGALSGLGVTFEGHIEADLEPEKAVQVLHLTREALHNIRKHAEASEAKVKVETEEDHVNLTISDDGKGFPFTGSLGMDELETEHIGPSSIIRRVRLLEGDLQIDSAPGNGSRLQVRFPK